MHKVLVLTNSLGLGGTEKAACIWAKLLRERGHNLSCISLEDGPRRIELEEIGIPISICRNASEVRTALQTLSPDVIHAHAPGYSHQGDLLGEALERIGRKIPVVQTNIFGQLRNSREDTWTDFRLFISWTSCVQAACRCGRKLDLDFFQHQSVASYPVEAPSPGLDSSFQKAAAELRQALGIPQDHIVLGRFSRPEPNKWSPLVLDAFLAAREKARNIHLLLREPPLEVGKMIRTSRSAPYISILPATADKKELTISQMACDVILHTSSIGESFGYGIAEPMSLGKAVITNSVPWHDQAQIELVRHGECGMIASTASSMKKAILQLAGNPAMLRQFGDHARTHILNLADPNTSLQSLETAFTCAIQGTSNPNAEIDLEKARQATAYLKQQQWGNSLEETLRLKIMDKRINLSRRKRHLQDELKKALSRI